MKVYVVFETSAFRDDERFVGIFWTKAAAEQKVKAQEAIYGGGPSWISYTIRKTRIQGAPLSALAEQAE